MPLFDPVPWRRGAGRRGEVGLRDEQLVLEAQHELREVRPGVREPGGRAAQVGPELVERPEGGEARVVLGYAGAAQETGLSTVTGAGV
jgi:hypothetical protein